MYSLEPRQKSSKSIKSARRKRLSIDKNQVIDMTQSINQLDSQQQIIHKKHGFDQSQLPGLGPKSITLRNKIQSYQTINIEKIDEKSKIVKNSFFYGDDSNNDSAYNQNSVLEDSQARGNDSILDIKDISGAKQPRRRLSSFKNRKASKITEGLSNQKQINIQELIDLKLSKRKQESKIQQIVLQNSNNKQGMKKVESQKQQQKQQQKQKEKEESQLEQNSQLIPFPRQLNTCEMVQTQSVLQRKASFYQSQITLINLFQHLTKIHQQQHKQNQQELTFHHYLTLPVPKDHIFQCYIKRLNRQVLMLFCDDTTFLIKCQKKSALIGCNYYFSSAKQAVKNNDSYLGKLRSDLSKSSYVLYDNGYSQKEGKSEQRSNKEKRMQCANIQYQNGVFQIKQPRKFRAIIPNPQIEDKTHFRLSQKQSLESLKIDYPHQLIGFKNRKPNWSEKTNSFGLDLGKRVKISSIKNFILETGQGQSALIFGKSDADSFNLQIKHPLSPYQGFGIAVSMFDVK